MLSNDGDEPLAVERVQGNCQCTAARVLEKVIPAHGQVAMELTLDLRHASQPLPRDFDTTVTLETTDPAGRRLSNNVGVRARVTASPIRLVDSDHAGGTVIRGVPESWERRFVVHIELPGELPEAVGLEGLIQQIAFEPGSKHDDRVLCLTLDPTLAIGPYVEFVKLTLPAGEHSGKYFIPVRGQVVGDAFATPATLVAGAGPVGLDVTEFVTVRTRSGRRISHVEIREHLANLSIDVDDSRSDPWRTVFRVKSRISEVGHTSLMVHLLIFVEAEEVPIAVEVPFVLQGIRQTPAVGVLTSTSD
jgi:hypothetical protein